MPALIEHFHAIAGAGQQHISGYNLYRQALQRFNVSADLAGVAVAEKTFDIGRFIGDGIGFAARCSTGGSR